MFCWQTIHIYQRSYRLCTKKTYVPSWIDRRILRVPLVTQWTLPLRQTYELQELIGVMHPWTCSVHEHQYKKSSSLILNPGYWVEQSGKRQIYMTAQLPCPDWNAPLKVASVEWKGQTKRGCSLANILINLKYRQSHCRLGLTQPILVAWNATWNTYILHNFSTHTQRCPGCCLMYSICSSTWKRFVFTVLTSKITGRRIVHSCGGQRVIKQERAQY